MSQQKSSSLPSAADLMLFEMHNFRDPNREELRLYMLEVLPEARRAAILAEKELVDRVSTPEEVMYFMRKGKEMYNRPYICDKALEFGDELIPTIIRRLKTSSFDFFIENAAVTLSAADDKYIDQLVNEYGEFRQPYAIGMLSVVLAFRERKDALPAMRKAQKYLKGIVDSETSSGLEALNAAIEMLEE